MSKDKYNSRPAVPAEQPPSPAGAAEGTPPPRYGTARPAEPAAELPRVLDPLERLRPGVPGARFKVRADGDPLAPRPTLYILAESEAQARTCYLEASGLDKHQESLAADGAKPSVARLVVKKLAD